MQECLNIRLLRPNIPVSPISPRYDLVHNIQPDQNIIVEKNRTIDMFNSCFAMPRSQNPDFYDQFLYDQERAMAGGLLSSAVPVPLSQGSSIY